MDIKNILLIIVIIVIIVCLGVFVFLYFNPIKQKTTGGNPLGNFDLSQVAKYLDTFEQFRLIKTHKLAQSFQLCINFGDMLFDEAVKMYPSLSAYAIHDFNWYFNHPVIGINNKKAIDTIIQNIKQAKNNNMKILYWNNGDIYEINIDNNNNLSFISKAGVVIKGNNLINCNHCISCDNCTNCSYCFNSIDLTTCNNCDSCDNCNNCTNCDSCVNCNDCRNCIDNRNCNTCTRCNDCIACRNCIDCSSNCLECVNSNKCEKCEFCDTCNNCYDCKYCDNCNMCYSCQKAHHCNDCTNIVDVINQHNVQLDEEEEEEE